MHIAELNIAHARYDFTDPRMADFMAMLDGVNAVAERSEGFVWRLKGDSGPIIDARLIVNLTVWETAEALEHYVWQTVHKKVYNKKHDWFDAPREASFVMWPIEEGHIPTLDEAFARLEQLRTHGSSEHAYGWEGLPHLKMWLTKQCG